MMKRQLMFWLALLALAAPLLLSQQLASAGGGPLGGDSSEGQAGGRPDFMDRVPSFGSESALGLFALPVSLTNREDETVSFWRAEFSVTGKAFRSPKWALTANSSYSYLGVSDETGTLTTRLVRLRSGLTATVIGSPMLTLSTSLGYASDFARPKLRDLTLSQMLLANFRLDTEWSLAVGLAYTYGSAIPITPALRYIPIPFVSATWRPSDKLRVTLGLPLFSVDWKPNALFELQAAVALPYAGRVILVQRVAPWLVVREFFGRHSEDYNLTDSRWENYSRVELAGWGAGASIELLPFSGLINEPQLRNSAIRFTYQLGVLQRWRVYTYDDNDNRFTYELAPSHTFALNVTLSF